MFTPHSRPWSKRDMSVLRKCLAWRRHSPPHGTHILQKKYKDLKESTPCVPYVATGFAVWPTEEPTMLLAGGRRETSQPRWSPLESRAGHQGGKTLAMLSEEPAGERELVASPCQGLS